MGTASDIDFYDCRSCSWRFYVEAPRMKYGTLTTKIVPPVCPQCGSGEVAKS